MAAKGLVARGVPLLPQYLLYLQGAVIILSIIILALGAYGISLYGDSSYYYSSSVPGFLIFVAILTWIVYGGSLALGLLAPRFYYRIVVLAGHILSVIFWLTGWAWAASSAAYVRSFDNYYGYESVNGNGRVFGDVMGACAGLGALEWILCIIILVIMSRACFHSPSSTYANDVEMNHAHKQDVNAPDQEYTTQPVDGAQHSPRDLQS